MGDVAESDGVPAKKWACPTCPKTFGKKEHLVRHERSHTALKPYACHTCDQCFGRRDVLVRHLKTKHGEDVVGSSKRSQRQSSTPNAEDVLTDQPSVPTEIQDSPPRPSSFELPDLADAANGAFASFLAGGPPPESLDPDVALARHETQPQFSPDSAFFNFEAFSPLAPAPGDLDMDALLGAFLGTPNHGPPPCGGGFEDLLSAGAESLAHFEHGSTVLSEGRERSDHWRRVARAWPTFYEAPPITALPEPTGATTPRDGTQIDESTLKILQDGLSDEPPTSPDNVAPLLEADFLRLALETFWTRLYPSFSVIHRPTFRPHRYPLLTLSLACVGAVYIGSAKAQHVARELYLHVKHRVIIQISEGQSSVQEPGRLLALLQAAFFGQLYGCLCGSALALHTSRMYNVPLFHFARSLLLSCDQHMRANEAAPGSLDFWGQWVQAESVKRVIYGLFWQTSLLGSVMRGPAPFVLQLLRLDWPCDESAFASRTPAEAWALVEAQYRSPTAVPEPPAYRDIIASLLSPSLDAEQQLRLAVSDRQKSAAILNGLAVIAHSMSSGTWPDDLNTSSHIAIKRALLIWHSNHLAMGGGETGPDALMRLETFHLAFLHLLVPFEAVELACGKDGPDVLDDSWLCEQLRLWAGSPLARLALLHAGQIWSLLGSSYRQQCGGLLLPTAALHASLVIWAYQRFGAGVSSVDSIEITSQVNWSTLDSKATHGELRAKVFTHFGGNCTLGGIRINAHFPESAFVAQPCEMFAAQLAGTSNWGQTQQIIDLLNLLASPLCSPSS